MKTQTLFVRPSRRSLTGTIRVPGDKSISHRAIMLGSLAEGHSTVTGFLTGKDCLATLAAFRNMGVQITQPEDDPTTVHIEGVGLHGLRAPTHTLDVGNSGTSIRLMLGILSGQAFDSVIAGDASLSKRPMRRVSEPLAQMGAVIRTSETGTPPLHISGNQALRGIDYTLPMASAQVKSCLLLAGLYAEGDTQVSEPAPCRDHTERMLRTLGYAVETDGQQIRLSGGGQLEGTDIHVPGDISSAAFLMVAASIALDADLTIEAVGINPTRDGIIQILRQMGADITLHNERNDGAEPVADIRIRSAKLQGIDIPEALVPLAIDEFPCLFVAAACAYGITRLTGAEELRAKESDRIQVMADALQAIGVEATPTDDGMVIVGGTLPANDNASAERPPIEIATHHDHRIAMSMSLTGLVGVQPLAIQDAQYIQTSFPGFVELMQSLGADLTLVTSER